MSKDLEKIKKYGEKKKSAKLMKYLNSKDSEIRIAAMRALGACGDETGYNTLVNMMNDPNPEVRVAAATGLGETKKDSAFTHLSHHINTEKDEKVIDAIRRAMSKVRETTHNA